MSPQASGGGGHLRNLRVAHLKRKAEADLKQGNYGHAAERYSEAVNLLLPRQQLATAAAQPLLSAPLQPAASSTVKLSTEVPAASNISHPESAIITASTATAGAVAATASAQILHTHTVPPVATADIPELRALLSNRSLACLKAGKAAAAAEDAAAVVALAPGWHKGHWRLGKALSALSRWSDALDCFALAWSLSEPGSAEQADCEQQLLAAVKQLTRQQLADRLLEAAVAATAAATTHLKDAAAHAGPHCQQQQQQQQHLPTAVAAVAAGHSAALQKGAMTKPAATGAAVAGLLAQRHPEELREGMFQLVKLAQQQQQHGGGASQQQGPKAHLHRMQALLLKWLLLNSKTPSNTHNAVAGNTMTSSSSSGTTNSSSRPRGAMHLHSSILPAVLDLELQLLAAQLAVRVKCWGVAQQVAAALQLQLKTMVLPDEGVLLQLLVDTHITLGEAFWAGGPDNSTTSTTTTTSGTSTSTVVTKTAGSGNSSATAPAKAAAGDSTRNFCHPYKAAAACLTALDLLPVSRSPPQQQASGGSSGSGGSNGGSSSSGKVPWSFLQVLLRAGGLLAGSSTAAADQMRRDIQGRLDAALEQLDDCQQAAVWAAAAAARSSSSSAASRAAGNSSTSSGGTNCAATGAAAARQNKTPHLAETAAAAGAVSGCAGTGVRDGGDSSTQGASEGVHGWELACMQLGVAGTLPQQHTGGASRQQVAPPSPSLLLEVTLAANMAHPTPFAGGSSDRNARGLSGPDRVALLKCLSKAAGVGRLAVALGQLKLAQTYATRVSAAAGEGAGMLLLGGWHHRFQELTFRVQFGADGNAATAFASLCSSLPTLLSACPQLAAALVVQDSMTTGPAGQGDAAALEPAATVTSVANAEAPEAAAATAMPAAVEDPAGEGLSDPMLLAATAACLQLYQVAAVTVTDVLTGAVAGQAVHSEKQLPTAAGEVEGMRLTTVDGSGAGISQAAVDTRDLAAADSHCPDLPAVSDASDSSMAAVDTRDLAAVDSRRQDLAAVGTRDLAAIDTRDLAAVDASDSRLAAVDSRHQELAAVGTRDLSASAVIPLPYAHYSLVGEDGRPLERPDKHPFALSRVMHDARDLPASAAEVWFEAPDGAYRWRQTASTVLMQLHALPDDISSAKQLLVTIEPYALTVKRRGAKQPTACLTSNGENVYVAASKDRSADSPGSDEHANSMLDACGTSSSSQGELLFEAELARGIVPEDSTWVLMRPDKQRNGGSGGTSSNGRGGSAAAGALLQLGAGVAFSSREKSDGCYIMFELEKMNLELYERPNQHSASWWPRLFVDDAVDIAWDDSHKDYTDLPPAIAAAAAAEKSREEQRQRQQEERKAAAAKLEALVLRHKQYRWERLRELKEAAWNTAASSRISSSSQQ